MAIGIVSDSHPHDDQQFVGYNDIIGTVTEEIIATTKRMKWTLQWVNRNLLMVTDNFKLYRFR